MTVVVCIMSNFYHFLGHGFAQSGLSQDSVSLKEAFCTFQMQNKIKKFSKEQQWAVVNKTGRSWER